MHRPLLPSLPRASRWLTRSFMLSAALATTFASAACIEDEFARVPQPGQISGRVCDPGEGGGVIGASVWVEYLAADGTSRQTKVAITDAEGKYVIEGVPAGEQVVKIQRGSFQAEVRGVTVREEETTELSTDEEQCTAIAFVDMTVYNGHDNVQEVLGRLGYDDFDIIETHHRRQDRPDGTESWLVTEFGDYENFKDNDILFINCGAHEWALEGEGVDVALRNLRDFVANGGSIYLSDWAYSLLEAMYPDAIDWVGEDANPRAARVGTSQTFVADVHDSLIKQTLARPRATLRFEQGNIAMVEEITGDYVEALITADIETDGNGTLKDAPVLLRVNAPNNPNGGRVIYTSFHNGNSNTPDMDELLRAIIFSL